jgi:hypothetical protein
MNFVMSGLRLTRFILLVAIVAILARAVIPTGYMPETGNGKTFQMTICSMEGSKTITVDDKFHPVSSDHHAAKETCPFSILTHSPFDNDVAAISFDAPYQIAATQKIAARDQFVRRHVFYSLAQPRAPPVSI